MRNESVRIVTLQDAEEVHLSAPYKASSKEDEIGFRRRLQERTIGNDAYMDSPFGRKKIAYFDYGAAGRSFSDVEDELNDKVLPYFANTHSAASFSGDRMTRLCRQARERISAYINAGSEDAVIFTGSGCTGAVNKMVQILGIRLPERMEESFGSRNRIPDEARPVIFTSLMEHHSNDVPWRETIGDTVYVGFDSKGSISLPDLEKKLEEYAHRPFKIGSFSAGSNITGVISDTYEIAKLLHRHGALAFFDFAAVGPYVKIDMNPVQEEDPEAHLAYKDAVFLSPHKFTGGPRCPGILVAKKALFTGRTPTEPGGGTVLYVTPWNHLYAPDVEARESGGTPPIIQIIQAGLVFDLKERIGVPRIMEIKHAFVRRAFDRWNKNPEITVLGPCDLEGLGILSITVQEAHYNLINAMLNDLFGVQARAGCMCAGPYGHELLGIDRMESRRIEEQVGKGQLAAKFGWVRFCFSPVTSEKDFSTLLEAVDFVTTKWREFAPKYRMNEATGEFSFTGL